MFSEYKKRGSGILDGIPYVSQMRYLAREIYYIFVMLKIRLKNKTLKVHFRAKASLSSRFMGHNKLSHHSFFSGELGYASYIGAYSLVDGKIGKYCSIADHVSFLSLTHPVKEYVSTHPCFYSLKKQSGFTYVKEQLFNEAPLMEGSSYSIEVGNDVYIGYGAIVIGPCKIGNGAVVAAGAVVTGNIPDYAIVGGVPAKIIRYRFTEEERAYLQELQWWDRSEEWIKKYADSFRSVEMLRNSIQKDG